MFARSPPENTFKARILLQASICWSAGVVSVVQSGPSCFFCWVRPGADHSAVASTVSIRIDRRIHWSSRSGRCVIGLVMKSSAVVQASRGEMRLSPVGQMVLGHDGHPPLPTALSQTPFDEKRPDSQPDIGILPPGRYGGDDL